jgi:hypothetical protein
MSEHLDQWRCAELHPTQAHGAEVENLAGDRVKLRGTFGVDDEAKQ